MQTERSHLFIFIFIDDLSQKAWIYFLKKKKVYPCENLKLMY